MDVNLCTGVGRHERLASLLDKLRTMTCPSSQVSVSPERTHPLALTSTQVKDVEIDKVSVGVCLKESGHFSVGICLKESGHFSVGKCLKESGHFSVGICLIESRHWTALGICPCACMCEWFVCVCVCV